jgi:hypothetical protein
LPFFAALFFFAIIPSRQINRDSIEQPVLKSASRKGTYCHNRRFLFYSPIVAIFPAEALAASTVSSSPFFQPAFALGTRQAASLRPHLFQRSGRFLGRNDPLSNQLVQYPERPVHGYLLLFRGFPQVPVTG